jgi:hypothetical protein
MRTGANCQVPGSQALSTSGKALRDKPPLYPIKPGHRMQSSQTDNFGTFQNGCMFRTEHVQQLKGCILWCGRA